MARECGSGLPYPEWNYRKQDYRRDWCFVQPHTVVSLHPEWPKLVEARHRSLIRRLTGAHRRDREMRQAVQAGVVRRAFLRGLSARECAEPQLMAAFEPPPAVPLSDLELARVQLAAANVAAAGRMSAADAPNVLTLPSMYFSSEPSSFGNGDNWTIES